MGKGDARLPDCKIARLPDWKIARLQDWKIGRLPDCKIARLPQWNNQEICQDMTIFRKQCLTIPGLYVWIQTCVLAQISWERLLKILKVNCQGKNITETKNVKSALRLWG